MDIPLTWMQTIASGTSSIVPLCSGDCGCYQRCSEVVGKDATNRCFNGIQGAASILLRDVV